jgi:FAD binding domain
MLARRNAGEAAGMDIMTDDVVVVGGRCAGAPTAMLLARAGLSVRLLERSPRLGDVVSGHLIKPAGVARLRRWDVLDTVLATGCPQMDDRVLWLDGQPKRPPPPEPGTGAIAPRRTILDPILLTAAAQAGAKVEMGVSVHGLLRERGRVTGVATSAGQRSARLVIGADGRNSRIARLAGAETYHDSPPVTFGYYTYWRGCPVTGMHAWLEPRRFFGVFPVGDDLALAFVQGPHAEYPAFRRDALSVYAANCGRVLLWPCCSRTLSSRSGYAAPQRCPPSSAGRRGPVGRWSATPAITRTRPSPAESPTHSGTQTWWRRPSSTAGTATWRRPWSSTGSSAIDAPFR